MTPPNCKGTDKCALLYVKDSAFQFSMKIRKLENKNYLCMLLAKESRLGHFLVLKNYTRKINMSKKYLLLT